MTTTTTTTTTTTSKGKGKRPTGVILYRGPSMLDGKPIVVIAVGLARRSKNVKTGKMIPVYILADAGLDPLQAIQDGSDVSICGNCPQAGKVVKDKKGKSKREDRTCYVNVGQAPLAIYRASLKGAYPVFSAADHGPLFAGRFVRLGAYGDPAAVPFDVWGPILSLASGHTAYTHQWRTCDQRLATLAMASCDTERQYEDAIAMGWRSFRVRLASSPVRRGEFICPASEEAGKRLTCLECRACSGAKAGGANASPVIILHGPKIANNFRLRAFERLSALLVAEETRRVSLNTI